MDFTLSDSLGILSDLMPQEDLEDFFAEMYESWVADADQYFYDYNELSKKHYQMRLVIHIIKLVRNDQSRKTKCVPSDTGNADAHNSESH